jgi:hypothetical protein
MLPLTPDGCRCGAGPLPLRGRGYSFDRFYFEGEDYGDRRDNRLDVGSGPFAAVRVGVRF